VITPRIRPLASGTITAPFNTAWQLLAGPLSEPAFLMRIYNASNVDIAVSYDDSTTSDHIPAGAVLQLHAPTNPQYNCAPANWPQGTQIWIKGIAASTGNVYFSAYTYYSGE
jgi:hypothetical protein